MDQSPVVIDYSKKTYIKKLYIFAEKNMFSDFNAEVPLAYSSYTYWVIIDSALWLITWVGVLISHFLLNVC